MKLLIALILSSVATTHAFVHAPCTRAVATNRTGLGLSSDSRARASRLASSVTADDANGLPGFDAKDLLASSSVMDPLLGELWLCSSVGR